MNPTSDPDELYDRLRKKFCEQSADLVNRGGIPPLKLVEILNEAAIALGLMAKIPRSTLSNILREQANAVDRLDEPSEHREVWN